MKRIDCHQRVGASVVTDLTEEFENLASVDNPQTLCRDFRAQCTFNISKSLFQQGQSVTHPTIGCARDNPQCVTLCGNVFCLTDPFEGCHNLSARNAPEIVTLTTTSNGFDHLVGLGRCKNKMYAFRGFFQQLQERVEGLVRQHVHFIDDENPATPSRSNPSRLL